MKISVRYLNHDMIKPSNNVGLASVVEYLTYKVLINFTILRSFIPPKVQKMTPKLCQICGWEICIIPKGMQIDFNILRTRLVIYLQQKSVRCHTRNSLFITTSYEHFKHKVFPDGNFLQTTIKDEDQCIICITIKPKNLINIKCDLSFVMNGLSIIFLMKNYMMNQMLH